MEDLEEGKRAKRRVELCSQWDDGGVAGAGFLQGHQRAVGEATQSGGDLGRGLPLVGASGTPITSLKDIVISAVLGLMPSSE